MSRLRPSLAALGLAPVAALALLTSCSSSGGGAATTPPATPTAGATSSAPAPATTSAGASTATSAAGTATASSGGGASLTACAESQLRASVSPQSIPGLDRHVVRLVFANISGTACTLTGYPGAAIVDSSGAQVQQAKRVIGGPVAGTVERVATLTVQPGASVFAYLEGQSTREVGAAQAGCDAPKYPRILVTPPNTHTAVPFTVGWPVCYSFDVHPVRTQ